MSGTIGNPPKAVRSVQWAPNLDRHFVQWSHAPGGKATGSDLTLYECSERSTGSATICKPTIKAINKDFESVLVTCFRWSPSLANPYHFAAGVSTGQVVISSFQPIPGSVPPQPEASPWSSKPTVLVKGGTNQRAITQRQCKCVSWNATQDNLLVAGLAVLTRRSDAHGACVQVWDIQHQNLSGEQADAPAGAADPENAMAAPPLASFNVQSNPSQSYVKEETCNAVEWDPRNSAQFAAGFQKGLRLFDIRENRNQYVQQATASVALLAFDPGCESRLATCSSDRDDTWLKIWDLRFLTQGPLMQVQATGTPKRIQWCPGVDGVLSAVVGGAGEDGLIQLWGVRSNEDHRTCYMSQLSDDAKPAGGKPEAKGRGAGAAVQATSDALWTRRVETGEDISSFDWHPTQGGRVLAVSSEDVMRDIKLSFSSALSFSPHGALLFTSDSTLFQSSEGFPEDMAEIMRERAIKGYVLDPSVNAEICRTMQNHDLAQVWQIVQRLQKGKEDMPTNERPAERVSGLADLLSKPGSESKPGSTKVYKPLLPSINRSLSRDRLAAHAQHNSPRADASGSIARAGSGGKRRSSLPEEPGRDVETDNLVFEVYVSEERRHALKVCSFDFGERGEYDDDKDYKGSEALEKKVTNMQRKGQYDQAAFIRLLQVDLSSSLECLYKGASHNPDGGGMYAMAAVALAGAANQGLPVWRRAYQHMMELCKEPYLRALFLILNRDLDGVMKEEGLTLMDRVAFACRYMPDSMLKSALNTLLSTKVKRGQLDAILLLGLGPDSLPLLNSYVSATSDLQTAALLMCFFTSPPRQDSGVGGTPVWELWLEEYREMLDRLELWEQRAVLDIALTPTLRPAPPAEVHVVCTSCQAPVTFGIPTAGGEAAKAGSSLSAEVKSSPSQCKNCLAELPRCCLCLMPMGCNNAPTSTDVSLPPILPVRPHDAGPLSSDEVVRPLYSRSHFDSWFAWCQQCHHGGHVGHLQHWFASNSICPVTGCKCLCLTHDSYLPHTNTPGPKPSR